MLKTNNSEITTHNTPQSSYNISIHSMPLQYTRSTPYSIEDIIDYAVLRDQPKGKASS